MSDLNNMEKYKKSKKKENIKVIFLEIYLESHQLNFHL